MNRRQRLKRHRLEITKLAAMLLEKMEPKPRRTYPLMYKKWVHKRWYIRRKTTVAERMMIHYCFYWLMRRIDNRGTSRFLLKCLLKGDSPNKADQKLQQWKDEIWDRFETRGMW